MAATYDGVGMAVIVWAFMFGVWCLGWGLDSKIQPVAGVPIIVVLVLVAIACWREAGRYVIFQVEELVATIAAHSGKSGAEKKNEKGPSSPQEPQIYSDPNSIFVYTILPTTPIKNAPNSDSKSIFNAKKGDKLIILDEINTWYKVKTIYNRDPVGWVSKRWLIER
jgi:hypothetical protein